MRFGLVLLLASMAAPAWAADRSAATAEMHRGIALLYQGNAPAARVALVKAIVADPEWGLPRAVQGRIMLALGDGAGAETELRAAEERGVPLIKLRHLYGHAALLQGDRERAIDEASADTLPPLSASYAQRIIGQAALASGDFALARQSFDKALALTPQSSLLWLEIGRFRMASGDVSGALDAARRSVAFNPRNIDGLMLMGELVRGQFGLVAAIPWYEGVIKIDPGHLGAMTELAATLGDAGRARAMLSVTRKILEIDPGNPKAYFLQAVLAARAGDFELARAMMYRTKNQIDGIPAVMLLNAVLYLKDDNGEQATKTLTELVKAQPANLKAKRLLGAAMWRSGDAQSAIAVLRPVANRPDADSYTLSVIGRAYEEQGNGEAAALFLDRAAAPVRGDPVPFEMAGGLATLAHATAKDANNADVAIPQISRMIAAGQTGAALAKAQQLAKANPGAPAAHMLVGDAYAAMQRPQDAAFAYQAAANIRFSEPIALRFIDALSKAGREGAALRVLDMFLSQNPRSVPGLLLAADHFMATGSWDRAIGVLEGLRGRLGNRDATLLGNLGWAWFNKRDYAKATEFSAAAYAIAPSNPAVANSYGWILFKSGKDKVQGVRLLSKAAAIAPNHPGLAFQLGEALLATGRPIAAKAQLQKAAAAKDFPDHAAATAMLARL
ncbi:MAG: tetratricopeptide repeat protein [Sphingomonadaceae bacterium]